MKEFKVRIVVTEIYSTYVMAEDEEQAEDIAIEWLSKGILDMNECHMDTEIEETGYEE